MQNRVYGVDFSGGMNAGHKIWIAGGVVEGDKFRLETCERASELFGSGKRRDAALEGLQTFIRQQAPCVVGLDFPFGLPRKLVSENQWDEFTRNFADRFPDVDDFKRVCTTIALEKEGRKELRRETDKQANTPFSPYNLRIYRQTYYGIRDVLADLVRSDQISVLPMQPAVPDRAWVIEICPASTLKSCGLYQTYKNAKSAAVRDEILSNLETRMGMLVPEGVRSAVLGDKDGDALDSVIAAFATFRALQHSINLGDMGNPSLVEGRVYV